MREAELLVDVTLVFGHRRVPCHKVILAGTCEYFNCMFATGMVECASKEIVMEGINASTGVLIIDFLYGRCITITTQNAQDLLAASDMLLLYALKQNIEEYLFCNTEISNCISLLNLARIFYLKRLLEVAQNYLQEHVCEFINTKEMHLLQEEDIIKMLAANRIQEDSFCLVQKWVRSVEGRIDLFSSLMEHIRLSQCSKEFIRSTVMKEELMTDELSLRLLHPPEPQSLVPIKKPPFLIATECHSACAFPGGFIISGGYTRDIIDCHECYSFKSHNSQWRKLPPMGTARRSHASVYHDHHLYVVGGRDTSEESTLKSVEMLDMRSLQWSYLPPLPTSHADFLYAAFVSDRLYVFGGITDEYASDPLFREVLEYNPSQRTWRLMSPMPMDCSWGGAVSLDNRIYVTGGYEGSCMQFNPRNDTWAVLQGLTLDYHSAPLVWRGSIVICGGCDDSSIHEYSPLNDEWTEWRLRSPRMHGSDISFALSLNIPS
ncbi:hypothetical protein CAPTEDRAFT_177411 [Capitella teleta]|uniref:BTB domain-containing protein n=1 Tax=Capitella teleta TaxID=283909 RepID=R7V6U2_CAPTE|nr:hypothetical protein CAPTEDRAFT_177411 [Capitella teleta]|eukprot:ELU12086.1 hypothetical protein CAPTEDRAFT_177411 [Capitella teleta]